MSRKAAAARNREGKGDRVPTLRDRLNERTRELIVDALVAQLGEKGAFEFSFFEVARRAGVSVRTVYRHFPTREALFEAMSARINERIGFREYPTSIDGMKQLSRLLFPAFDANADLILAQMQTNLGRQVRSHARRERLGAMQRLIEAEAPHLDPYRRRALAGVMGCLLSADIWKRLRDELDVDGAAAGQATAWALGVLHEALVRENEAAARSALPSPAVPAKTKGRS
jgi:AcrR family transcriptional regulator